MKSMMKKLALALPVAALGLASTANAGFTSETGWCVMNADGSGYCHGNMLGFRNDVNSSTYAQFYQTDAGSKYFTARYTVSGASSSSYYSCTPNTSVTAMWQEAMLNHGYFSVYWDVNGTCYSLALYNGSQYANF